MNKDEIEALLKRVEEATGADVALDEAIALALCDEHHFSQLADAPDGVGCEMYRIGTHAFSSALRVTASIDAALALVERVSPGAEYELSTMYGVASADLPLNDSDSGSWTGSNAGGNMPLAIIMALLIHVRARSLSAEETGK